MISMTEQLKALSDETRLRIVNLLYERELCVCDIIKILNITQTKASRHLSYLKNNKLVKDRKEAQWSHYKLINEKKDFLEVLVINYLRKEEIYKRDLKVLNSFNKEENIKCAI